MSNCLGAGTRSKSDCWKERCGNVYGYDALFFWRRNQHPVISLFKFSSKPSTTQTTTYSVNILKPTGYVMHQQV